MHICVADNGFGLTSTQLAALRQTIFEKPDEPADKVGLRNIYQRILLTFDNNISFSIDAAEGIGASVNISFPLYEYIEEIE
ncbi:hypothetical protein FACS1894184_13450 [Clostridia bacterium]|nr:hypothetical protein FACS1894184_13450 [Clostridia bacterium]